MNQLNEFKFMVVSRKVFFMKLRIYMCLSRSLFFAGISLEICVFLISYMFSGVRAVTFDTMTRLL